MGNIVDTASLQASLAEQGVKYAMASYVDIHGCVKGKFVPLDHLDNMFAGSELYTGAALDGVPQPAPAPRFSRTPAPPPSSSEANFGAGAEADEALLRTFGAASARIEAARAVGAL